MEDDLAHLPSADHPNCFAFKNDGTSYEKFGGEEIAIKGTLIKITRQGRGVIRPGRLL